MKVGDCYDVDGVRGVVFRVWDGGRHGKIVSTDEALLPWAEDGDFDGVNPARTEIRTTDNLDGALNQRVVESIEGWREMYPAFAWCADHGEGWYLPAVDEVRNLLLDDEVCDAVNRTLSVHGKRLKDEAGCYWSSTEFGKVSDWFCVWYVNIYCGVPNGGSKNFRDYAVRAVATF